MTSRTFHSTFAALVSTFAALLFLSFLSAGAGCSGAAGSPSGSAGSATDATQSAGDASFSYTMDGMSFSGKGTDDFANCAFRNKSGVVNFVLMNIAKNQKGIPTQINIFAPTSGTATYENGDSKYSVEYSYQAADGAAGHTYQMTSMTVTILSNTGSRISGTFSGNFEELNEHRKVALTDGKFDIPYSTHSPK